MPRERLCQGQRGRPPFPCPDPARRARCNLLASAGDFRACRSSESGWPRADHWLTQAGEATLAAAVHLDIERTRLLFDLAVRADETEEIRRWSVQAAFDASPEIRRATIAAIVTFAAFVPRRRADARATLQEIQTHAPDPALTAGLAAIAAVDTTFFAAIVRAAPEHRVAMLTEWAAARLAGRPLREPEWRRLAGHVHAGRRGERLLRRILRARTTGDVRHQLQRLHERRGGKIAAPIVQAIHGEHRADPWDDHEDPNYYDHDDDRDYDAPLTDDRWPLAAPSPAQQAALALLHLLGGSVAWSEHLGDRLSFAQRLALARHHPHESPDAQGLRRLTDPAPLTTLADLERLAFARRGDHELTHDLDPDALLADLLARLAEPAAPDPRLRCEALRLFTGQTDRTRALVAALPDVHPDQRPLVQLAALRPDQQGRHHHPDADSLVDLLHSDLAPLLMRHDLPPLATVPRYYRDSDIDRCIRDVLRSGAGSLRQLDYPSFTLTCRPSLSVVRTEHLAELRDLGDQLARLRAGLATDDPAQLLTAIDQVAGHFAAITPVDLAALVDHACAYATLRCEVLDVAVIREAHIRRFAARRHELTAPPPTTLTGVRTQFGEARLIEGLVHAMLTFAREPPTPSPQRARERRVWTHRLRLLSALYELPPTPVPAPGDEPEDAARALVEHLVRALEHAPLELVQALHIPHTQGLPKLGGVATPLERRLRHLLRRGLQLADDDDGELTRVDLRPLGKPVALLRGELGRDCSSRYVPLRCLSPHHTYYGLYTGDAQRPGYVTVFEAFAEPADGPRLPVLALETINVPDGALDGVHQDLLLALDAVASQRGLAGLVVVTGIGTWNYPNERLVTASRRHRQGREVLLAPADPPLWRAFERLSGEGGRYCAFRSGRPLRLLAPFDRARDLVQPENLAEVARLRALPSRDLLVTGRDPHGAPAAFISAVPPRE